MAKTTFNLLLLAFLAHVFASAFHFVHNAEFLDSYPNMPEWISRLDVYGALLALLSVGVLGIYMVVRGRRTLGLVVIGVFAALGFDGLAHYSLAPMSSHSAMMNLSIWLEVTTAAVLLGTVGTILACSELRNLRFK